MRKINNKRFSQFFIVVLIFLIIFEIVVSINFFSNHNFFVNASIATQIGDPLTTKAFPILSPRSNLFNLNSNTDLTITKVASPTIVQPGGIITFTINASNKTNQTLTQIQTYDPIPANTSYVANSATYDNTPVTDEFDDDNYAFYNGKPIWYIAKLLPEENHIFTFKVTQGVINTPEAEMVSLINNYRASLGLNALVIDSRISKAAQKHTQWMSDNGVLSHIGANGSYPWERCQDEGIYCTAEIIAYAGSINSAFVAWQNSSGHNGIMIGSYFYIGCGIVTPYYTCDFY